MDKKPTEKKSCRLNIFQRAISAGYSCLPCEGKRPAVSTWKKYMTELPTLAEAEKWKGNIGIVCGAVSGGVTCLDFDIKNGNRWEQWIYDVNNIAPELLSKLYMEKTPSGGYHVVFRSDRDCGSNVLAKNKTGMGMIETRGNGGYFVCASSQGYVKYFGKLAGLEKINTGDAELLIAICKSYNEYERQEYKPKKPRRMTGNSVFEKYDNSNNPCDLLVAHGWKIVYARNEKVYLRRPGKKDGISATWNAVPDRFYCFSTSTEFESNHVYKASAVYATLEHNGDFKAAYKKLSSQM